MIVFMLGITGRVLATNQKIDDGESTVENYVENTEIENNVQTLGTNTVPPNEEQSINTSSTDYANDISNRLQDMVSKQQPKDMRRQTTVTIIIIITVAIIATLIVWYYMTNQ